MGPLPFDMGVMAALADHRTAALTAFFLAASGLGEVQGYLLITTLIYVMVDKRLAVRLSLLVALTMCLNHMLKIVVQNPRPFIAGGDHLERWAVPADNARELAAEWSTPSGHAMAGASFYAFLYGAVRQRWIRVLAVLAILLTGVSRPYLGVHYVEDILLGWVIGLGAGLLALRYADTVAAAWSRLLLSQQVAVAGAASLGLWLVTVAVNGGEVDGQPRAFLGYAGTVTGVILGRALELRHVGFDPRAGTAVAKGLRFLVAVVLGLLTLEGLDAAFAAIVPDHSLAGYLLQYLRYVAVAAVCLFAAPWIFTRLGLATPSGAGTVLTPLR